MKNLGSSDSSLQLPKQNSGNQMPVNEDRPARVISFTSKLTEFLNWFTEWKDAFCRFLRPNIYTRKIDGPATLPEFPSWESLPYPASHRIFYHLLADEECTDLSNLAKVSTHFRTEVKKFIENNKPGIKFVKLSKCYGSISITYGNRMLAMLVKIHLYPAN
ncbi:hypothetical protein PMAYCL1PPCAC_22000, partial [Pristionchus mayeri]